jgi:hypothetical protein
MRKRVNPTDLTEIRRSRQKSEGLKVQYVDKLTSENQPRVVRGARFEQDFSIEDTHSSSTISPTISPTISGLKPACI